MTDLAFILFKKKSVLVLVLISGNLVTNPKVWSFSGFDENLRYLHITKCFIYGKIQTANYVYFGVRRFSNPCSNFLLFSCCCSLDFLSSLSVCRISGENIKMFGLPPWHLPFPNFFSQFVAAFVTLKFIFLNFKLSAWVPAALFHTILGTVSGRKIYKTISQPRESLDFKGLIPFSFYVFVTF